MAMLTGDQIAAADLTDRRKLGQGLHARYIVGDSGIAAAQGIAADPSGIAMIELALDTAHAATIAPVWTALSPGASRPWAAGPPATTSAMRPDGFRSCGSDDSEAPNYTVIADQDGNKACVCTALPAAPKDPAPAG